MSAPDYLTDEEIEELAEKLHDLEIILKRSLSDTKEGSRPVELDQPIGRLSRMELIQQQQMASANRRRAELRLERIRSALKAIENETYGECKICEEPIGYRRLSVSPEAPICVRCQTEREGS